MRTLPWLLSMVIACGPTPPNGDPGPGGKADGTTSELPSVVPKRVIWLIGDGMGVAQITAAAYRKGDRLAMLEMPELAFIATHEHEYATTDSAASASAMASGEKTHFEGVGVAPGTDEASETDADLHFTTVIDVAQEAGWRTGLVATTSLVDATPAAFAAHRAHRSSKDEIALDLLDSGVDVLLGGGSRWFEDRPDDENLVNDFKDAGYSITRTKTGLSRVANRATQVLGLFAERDMESVVSGERLVSLPTMTEKAIKILDRDNDDGFFLMVEGSWIDRESHAMSGEGTIAEALEFDQAVAAALEYARDRDDTLVIVTADHETGGLAVIDPGLADDRIEAIGGADAALDLTQFPSNFGATPPTESHERGEGELSPGSATDLVTSFGFMSVASRAHASGPNFLFRATHTATNVALFAEGPGAEFVTAVRDNADLGVLVKRLVAADGEAGDDEPEDTDEVPESIVLVVADGLGVASMTAAQYAAGDTTLSRMPNLGLSTAHAEDALTNDSAGSMTTLSSGQLAERGQSGLAGVASLLSKAENSGRRTALVTTSDITAPSVAALYSDGEEAPGDALVDFSVGDGIDLIFAGGSESLSSAQMTRWLDRGIEFEDSWSSSAPDSGVQSVRLIAEGDMPLVADRAASAPSLAEMTELAIETLEDAGEPYVLVVYASGLGRATAALERGTALTDELIEIDEVARMAMNTVSADKTAVLVASLGDSSLSVLDNHYGFHKGQCGIAERCGGEVEFVDIPLAAADIHRGEGFDDSELQGDFDEPGILLQYAWVSQQANRDAETVDTGSANFVPVYGSGPGTTQVRGFQLQTELAGVLHSWLDD